MSRKPQYLRPKYIPGYKKKLLSLAMVKERPRYLLQMVRL